jgi:LysR family transcriptional activator of nhaA
MPSADLNYHHLRLFLAVVRVGSVSAAARRLHLTPQTVSEQVRAFEQALDVVLFDRSGRALVPTATGRLVASYAADIFDQGRELLEVVRQQDPARPLRVVVGISDAMPKSVVRRLLEPVFALGRRVRLTARENRVDRLLAALAVNEIDVVLSDAPTPTSLRLKTFDHLLGTCGATLVAASPLASTLRRTFPQSLDGAPLLMPGTGTQLRGMLEQWLDRQGVHPVVVAEFDDSALAAEVAAEGIGAMIVPSVIVKEVGRRHRLKPVAPLPGIEERFYAICPQRRMGHPAVAALAEAARSELFAETG